MKIHHSNGGTSGRGSDQAREFDWVGSQGVTRVGLNYVCQVNGKNGFGHSSIVASSWEKNSTKEQWYLLVILFLERINTPIPAPPAVTQKLVNLASFHVFLALFEWLPLCWNLE